MLQNNIQRWRRWLTPGIGIKRWLLIVVLGLNMLTTGVGIALVKFYGDNIINFDTTTISWFMIIIAIVLGALYVIFGLFRVSKTLIAPYRRMLTGDVIDVVMAHQQGSRGMKFVAIGGGTGLPASLRGMKQYTRNITAIVTVADDGGSSGRLRREMGVLPPGDIRNNIVALADEDSLLARLFQYRFNAGELQGHSFGNLFIAALADVVNTGQGDRNELAEALVEVERVLNVRGRVLPATLDDVNLTATVRLKDTSRTLTVKGESKIGDVEGVIEQISLNPPDVKAYTESIRAINEADIIVIGPGSLYTSIIPNLLVQGIANALRATQAYKIYVCNVATQPVETDSYTVAEHVLALEKHIGRGVFQAVIANNSYPEQNAGANTLYVSPSPQHHEIHQRYEVRYTDLTDSERPWRHDPLKLAQAILSLTGYEHLQNSQVVNEE